MSVVADSVRTEVDMGQIEQLKSLRFRAQEAPSADLSPSRGRVFWRMAGVFVSGAALAVAGFALLVRHDTPREAAPVASAVAAPVSARAGDMVASGFVVARRQATIASEVTGRLTRLVVEEGKRVERGQLLAELDAITADASLANSVAAARSAAAEITGRTAMREDAAHDLVRQQKLAEHGFTTNASLQNKRSAYQVADSNLAAALANRAAAQAAVASASSIRSKYRIVAPFGGVVVSTNAEVGEIISPISAGGGFTRTGICTIVDMSSLEVEATVGEALIGRVRTGQPVSVVLDAYPDLTIPAQVIAIIPAVDRDRASIRVRIALLQKDVRILPDMSVKVTFEQGRRGKR